MEAMPQIILLNHLSVVLQNCFISVNVVVKHLHLEFLDFTSLFSKYLWPLLPWNIKPHTTQVYDSLNLLNMLDFNHSITGCTFTFTCFINLCKSLPSFNMAPQNPNYFCSNFAYMAQYCDFVILSNTVMKC